MVKLRGTLLLKRRGNGPWTTFACATKASAVEQDPKVEEREDDDQTVHWNECRQALPRPMNEAKVLMFSVAALGAAVMAVCLSTAVVGRSDVHCSHERRLRGENDPGGFKRKV